MVTWAFALVAAAGIGAVALTAASFLRYIRALTHEHARREQLLVNQLLHAVGKPWQESPADTGRRLPGSIEPDPDVLIQSPEQYDPVL